MDDPYPDIARNVTVLKTIECTCCKRPNTVRMNVSNRAYYTCKWPTGNDGAVCNEQARYSAAKTREIVRSYNQNNLKMKGPNDGQDTDENDSEKGGVYDFYK
jgi:LPS sulfotransferase NodH